MANCYIRHAEGDTRASIINTTQVVWDSNPLKTHDSPPSMMTSGPGRVPMAVSGRRVITWMTTPTWLQGCPTVTGVGSRGIK